MMKNVCKALITAVFIVTAALAFAGPASAGNCCGGSTYFMVDMQEAKAVSVFLGSSGIEMQVYTDPIPPETQYTYYMCLCICNGGGGTGTECQLTERHSDTKFPDSVDPGCIFSVGPPLDCHCGQQGCHH
jgi:hypothetical protein